MNIIKIGMKIGAGLLAAGGLVLAGKSGLGKDLKLPIKTSEEPEADPMALEDINEAPADFPEIEDDDDPFMENIEDIDEEKTED